MPKLSKVEGCDHLTFHCPGCGCGHFFNSTWQFNGDFEKPTVRPSIKVTFSKGPPRVDVVCHFHLTNGNIEFCNDCHHELSGKTVPMEDVSQ